MSGRDWKPGDVALVASTNGTRVIYTRTKTGAWNGVDEFGEEYTQRLVDGSARPLVVIDPEDREQVERLRQSLRKQGVLPSDESDLWRFQNGLREFANPTPPKPDEPRSLGAIVEDTDRGLTFVRQCSGTDEKDMSHPWLLIASREPTPAARVERSWRDFAAVRVLSEGVIA